MKVNKMPFRYLTSQTQRQYNSRGLDLYSVVFINEYEGKPYKE